jgi:hypothetical protein
MDWAVFVWPNKPPVGLGLLPVIRSGGRLAIFSSTSEAGFHGSPVLHAWIHSLIPAPLTMGVGDRTVCRTEPTSTTSSKSMRRASSRLSASCLSHNPKRAGFIHRSMVYLRAKMSRCKEFGGSIQRMAKSRMLVKPHRVERSRIEDHSSKERSSRVLKFLR